MDLNALIAALEANTAALIKDSEGFITQIKNLNGTLTSVGKERILKEREYFDVFKKSGVSFTDSVRSLTDGIKVGIRNMTKPMADLIGVTKRLNLNTRDYQELFAVNTQAIRASEEATYKLLNENIALGQRFNRSQSFMASLLASLQDTARVISLTAGAGTVQNFLAIGQTVGAAIETQLAGGIGQLLNKFTGSTLANLSNLARIGARPIGGTQSSEQLLDGIFQISERIDLMYGAVKGLSFSPELFQKLFGFASEDVLLARDILSKQNEIRNSLKANQIIQDNQVAFSKSINEFTRQIAVLFMPIAQSLLVSINTALTRLTPKIVEKITEFAKVIEGWKLEEKIPEWMGKAVDGILKVWDWLENKFSIQGIIDSIITVGYSVERWASNMVSKTISISTDIYHWLKNDASNYLESMVKTLGALVAINTVAGFAKGAGIGGAAASLTTLKTLLPGAAALGAGLIIGAKSEFLQSFMPNIVGETIARGLKAVGLASKNPDLVLPSSMYRLGRPDLTDKAESGNQAALDELIVLSRDQLQIAMQARDLLEKNNSQPYGPLVWGRPKFMSPIYGGNE